MSKRYNVTVPHSFEKDGKPVNRYTRVGVAFENTNEATGAVTLNVRLDFPVGATELVLFEPKDSKDQD